MPFYIYRVSRRSPARAGVSVAKADVTVTPAAEETTDGDVSYRDLQAQAKAAGIPANQSADELKKALEDSSSE